MTKKEYQSYILKKQKEIEKEDKTAKLWVAKISNKTVGCCGALKKRKK